MAHDVIQLDESTHTYYLGDQVIPGVTSVIEQITDYEGINPQVLKYKSALGTAVHKATELFDEDNLDEASLQDVLIPYVDAWKRFREESQIEILSSETRVFHKKHLYAGTYDRIGILNDEPCLIDIKCTSVLGPHVGVQLAAYLEAENSTRKKADHIQNRFAVQLKPDGRYKLEQYKDRSDFSTFLSCLQLYNWRSRYGKAA